MTRSHSRAVLSLAVLSLGITGASTPSLDEWRIHQRGGEISDADRTCANRSADQWSVSESGASVVVARSGAPAEERGDSTPPSSSRVKDVPHLQEFADGWLLGADRGEFGGGLWWTDRSGTAKKLLLAHNVRALRPGASGSVLVFAGMAHMVTDVGGVYRVTQDDGLIRTAKVGELDGVPRVVSETDGGYLAVTSGGVWQVAETGEPSRLVRIDLTHLIPRSVVRALDGTVYVGLSAFVLRLQPRAGGFEPEWLLPPDCPALVQHGGRCTCRVD